MHRLVIVVGSNADRLDYVSAEIFVNRLEKLRPIGSKDLTKRYSHIETKIITDEKFKVSQLDKGSGVVLVGGPKANKISKGFVRKLGLKVDSNYPGEEGYVLRTFEEFGYIYILAAGCDKRGTMYALGKLLRSLRIQDDGSISVPMINLVEKPVMKLRGTYLTFRHGNPFVVWCLNNQFHKLKRWLEDLALWGMNTVEICVGTCVPEFDNPWEGGEAATIWEMWLKIFEVIKSLNLDLSLVLCANLVPHTYVEKSSELEAEPWGRWVQQQPRGPCAPAFCPSKKEGRKLILETKEWYLKNVPKYEILHIFPRDGGGCGCSACSPDGGGRGYYKTYLELATDIIRLGKKYSAKHESMVNFWWFDRDEIEKMIPLIIKNSDITGVGVQFPYAPEIFHPSTFPRQVGCPGWDPYDFPISELLARRLCKEKKVILWPDVTMIGGWGLYGPYVMPRHIKQLFTLYDGAYGVIPLCEGPYDRINRLFMFSLAWNPNRDMQDVVKEVLSGIFVQDVPEELVDAIFLMEEHRLEEALKLLNKAEDKISVRSIDQLSQLLLLKCWCKHASIPIAINKLEKRAKEILTSNLEKEIDEAKTELNTVISDLEKGIKGLRSRLLRWEKDVLILHRCVEWMDELIEPSTARCLSGPRPLTLNVLEHEAFLSDAKELVSELKKLLETKAEGQYRERLKGVIEKLPNFEYFAVGKPIGEWPLFKAGSDLPESKKELKT